ncbi:MAG: alanine--tRNA ligase [Lachnospiraceae bacterium]|nr:alanine--tRNA ligase [Lachnospiraceae bacterium]
MQVYTVNELREMFLKFFEGKGHYVMDSFSLVPENDASLLLINAGMAPLKPYFTGLETPPSKRVATCQKCVRTGDIENVGVTNRHATFFEMLGNFSFGDYFKKEAIAWCWEFLTETVGLDPDRLYPSIYLDDDEAFEIWNKDIGIPAERIFRFGKEDNFWEHGTGPCGPCSEVYYDRGEKYGCGKPDCTVGCDCDRYCEVWNNVFTQFDGDGKGNYEPLENKNIDTGMGLERLAMVVQDVDSIFDIDNVKALRDHVCRIAGAEYGKDEKSDVSIRVITDHVRAVTFMLSDGIQPTNEGRGYVLRRLLRRACRHGRLLGIEGAFLNDLAETVIAGSKDAYPNLEEKKAFILSTLGQEEAQFDRTVDQGLAILEKLEKKLADEGADTLSGEDAFRLHDTFGFPLDLTKEILAEKGIGVDEEGFAVCMEKQKETARADRLKDADAQTYMGADATVYEKLPANMASMFIGYDQTEAGSDISAVTGFEYPIDTADPGTAGEEQILDCLTEGCPGTIFTDITPFYAEMGGQEADTGTISTETGVFEVQNVQRILGNKIGHIGVVRSGVIATNQQAELKVDEEKRGLSQRNHSATHLLHEALKEVLGSHVEQKGSSVNDQRLRFDFSHFQAMTPDEIRRVEELVNKEIRLNLPVIAENMPIEEARKTGAQALFGEKYGSIVRVVSMGKFSCEFCGGLHVRATGDIGAFKIISESGIAAGVRRIEALTSVGLLDYYTTIESRLHEVAQTLKGTRENVLERAHAVVDENKQLQKQIDALSQKLAKAAAGESDAQIEEIGSLKAMFLKVDDMGTDQLRDLGDTCKEKMGEGVAAVASVSGGKVTFLVTATDGAVKAGVHAGNIIREAAKLVGGGGGGRPTMAQAGGRNPDGIPAAFDKVREMIQAAQN